MTNLRFIHTADWHADSCPKKQAKLKNSLEQMLDYCKENKVEAIIVAGDIWDKKQTYTVNSGVPLVMEYLIKLADVAGKIFITKGNNSHDENGSVQLLHKLKPNIYAYEYPVSLACFGPDTLLEPVDLFKEGMNGLGKSLLSYIISLIPYPSKSGFVSNKSIDNNNSSFVAALEEVFELIGFITQEYKCSKLLAFHGNVQGSRLSTGQTLICQDIMVAPQTLEKANADYYALGHIHLRQEIKPNMVYSGSIYNKSWGETEEKSFEVIEVDSNGIITTRQHPLMATRMVTLLITFSDGKFSFEESEIGIEYHRPSLLETEYRLIVTLKENERPLLTDEKINELKSQYGQDVVIDLNVIPVQRESRSEVIMDCQTLTDEVKEYANVIEDTITDTVLDKINVVEEGL